MWRGIATLIATNTGGTYAKILAFIIFVLPMLIGMIIKLLGIVFIIYVGADLAVDYLTNTVQNNFNGLPTDLLQILKLAGVDTAIKMILSSLTAVMTIKAFSRTKKFKFLA